MNLEGNKGQTKLYEVVGMVRRPPSDSKMTRKLRQIIMNLIMYFHFTLRLLGETPEDDQRTKGQS